jgi:hypothetical protein
MARPTGVMHPVTVHISKDEAGKYHFNPESDLWDDGREEFVFHKDDHGMRKHDYHLIEFVIDDQTDEGLKFPKAPHDAMWVVEGHDEPSKRTCPDIHSVSNYDVMEPISVSPHQRRLFVRNDNANKEHWAFTINFVKEGEDPSDKSRFVSWDPGGSNQNGGSTSA